MLSQSDDDGYDKNHNEKNASIESMDKNISKQLLLGKIAIFKMKPDKKCEFGKAMTSEATMESLNAIQTSLDEIGHETSLEYYMIRSTKVKWLSNGGDMKG